MHVKKTPQKNGKFNIAIVEKYWKDGTSKTRTVLGLGRLDLLDAKYGDGYGYATDLAKQMTEEANEKTACVSLEIHPKEKVDKRQINEKNIGCAIPLTYYNSLGVEATIRNHTRGREIQYDANSVMRMLVINQLVHPCSKRKAHALKDRFFFRSDFSEDDVYSALGIFASCKDAIVLAMNKAISKYRKRNLEDAYYDVTNYYFEIDEGDDLRKEGVSKEKRKKPIVQMGLLQDKDGIPINFDIFAGNTQDCQTLLPVMKKAKSELELGHVVIVADKGLNTADNIAACTLDKNGFVFSQSIKGTKSADELRRWVLSESGYRHLPDNGEDGRFKIKSRQDTKIIQVKDDDGKSHNVEIETKTVAFWSAKYAIRAKKKRAKALIKAESLVKNPSLYKRAIHNGATQYIKGIIVNKETGEIEIEAGCVPTIDEQYIAQEEQCDGYYCIVTSEYNHTDEEILDIYKGLWRIEEAFKITKSLLRTRPVFVWTKDHIKAHFLICYIALTIVRLMQLDTKYRYSAQAILQEIAQMNGVHLQGSWWRFYHRSDLSDELASIAGLDLTLKNMRLEDIKKKFKKRNAGMITPV